MKTHPPFLSTTLATATLVLALTTASPAQTATTTTTKITTDDVVPAAPATKTTTATARTSETTAAPASANEGVEGTLRSADQEALIIQRKGDDEKQKPITYRSGSAVQYVDPSGNVLKRELLVPGTPVTVQYMQSGGSLTATRVIVHQEVEKTTAVASGAPGAPATAATTTETTLTTRIADKPTVAEGILGIWEKDRFELNTVKNGTVQFTYSQDTEFLDVDGRHVDAIRMKPGVPVTVNFKQVGDRVSATRVTVNARTVEVKR